MTIDTSTADIQALLLANVGPAAQAALTPDMQAALADGMAIASDLTPTYALINGVANGKPPSAQATVNALAGAATAVNPLAGAAVMAMGTLMAGVTDAVNGVMKSLGFEHTEPLPSSLLGGIPLGVRTIPSAPSKTGYVDPTWQTWAQLQAPVSKPLSLITVTVPAYYGPIVEYVIGYNTPQNAGDVQVFKVMVALAGAKGWTGNLRDESVPDLSLPTNAFEKAFFPVLQKDLEYFWNGNPFVSPRTLLLKFAQAWNDLHQVSTSDLTYSPAESKSANIGSWILSGATDPAGKRGSPLTINMGPRVQPPATVKVMTAGTSSSGLRTLAATILHVPPTNAGPAQVLHVHPVTGAVTPAKVVAPAGKPAPSVWPWLLLGGGSVAAIAVLRKG